LNISKLYLKITSFFSIGILSVSIDYLVYIGLSKFLFNIIFAKALGFISGTLFSFFGNKKLTFNANFSYFILFKYFLLYLVTLNLNILFNHLFLITFNSILYSVQISFVFTSGLCALINFIGLNYIVFYKKSITS